MSQFSYRAVTASGEVLQGQMEAPSVDDVIARLQDQGHTPLDAREANAAGGGGIGGMFRRGPFSGDQLALFTHQLATLLGAGQPLDRALGILLDLPDSERAKKLDGGPQVLERALEEIDACVAHRTAQQTSVERFLKKQ